MKKHHAFPSKYIKTDDLEGAEWPITISRVVMESIKGEDGKEETKAVLYCQEDERGLVLNATNWDTIADVLASDESDDWTGKKITLYPTKTQFGSKTVPCIRVAVPTVHRGARNSGAGVPVGRRTAVGTPIKEAESENPADF